MTSIQPELWADRGAQAVAFYQAAFGAAVLHRVGDGEDIVAQLAIGDAAFWVSTAGTAGQRLHPKAIGGATSRTLLVADDPDTVFRHAVAASAIASAQPGDEHGWCVARITDPFGHQWEIGHPSAPGRHPKPVTAAGNQRMQALPASPCTRRSARSAQRRRPLWPTSRPTITAARALVQTGCSSPRVKLARPSARFGARDLVVAHREIAFQPGTAHPTGRTARRMATRRRVDAGMLLP